MRIHIIQPVIPHYRVPFFKKIAARDSHEIKLFASRSSTGNPDSDASIEDAGLNIDLDFRLDAMFAGRLFRFDAVRVLAGAPDVVVLCGNVRYISNLKLIILAYRRRIGIVWFSHLDSSTSGGVGRLLRRLFMRMSDAILLYTSQERSRLIGEGLAAEKVFFTGNAIDVGDICDSAFSNSDERRSEIRLRLGLDPATKIILFVGRLTKKARVELVLSALSSLPDRKRIALVVVGGGEELDKLKLIAEEIGVTQSVIFLGEIVDNERLAGLFTACDIFVYPGDVGLSILHALYFGVPSIIHDDRRFHNPEADAFEVGVDGWTFRRNSPQDLSRAITCGLNDSPSLGSTRAERSRTATNSYSMTTMVDGLLQACDFAYNRKNQ